MRPPTGLPTGAISCMKRKEGESGKQEEGRRGEGEEEGRELWERGLVGKNYIVIGLFSYFFCPNLVV